MTARGGAGEHDQMMRDHRDGDEVLDLAAPELAPGEAPERPPVVAEHPDLPDDLAHHDETALDARPALHLVADGHLDAPGMGVVALMLVARKQPLRLIRHVHAAPPRGDHL